MYNTGLVHVSTLNGLCQWNKTNHFDNPLISWKFITSCVSFRGGSRYFSILKGGLKPNTSPPLFWSVDKKTHDKKSSHKQTKVIYWPTLLSMVWHGQSSSRVSRCMHSPLFCDPGETNQSSSRVSRLYTILLYNSR